MRDRLLVTAACIGLSLMICAPAQAADGPGGTAGGPPADHSFDDLKPPPAGVAPADNAVFAQLVPPAIPNMPQPSLDPHQLDGAWLHENPLAFLIDHDINDLRPPYNPRAHRLLARRLVALAKATPYLTASATCRPPGVPWQQDLNFPFLIFQSKDRIEILYQEYHGLQTIYMDQAKAPAISADPAKRPYMGVSIGHWDGGTLVVVTKGMKQAVWLDLDGTPASAQAVITQRIRKVNEGHWALRIETTLDDPVYYTHPWSWVRNFAWRPERQVLNEYDCETQVGDKTNNYAGLTPEPPEDK